MKVTNSSVPPQLPALTGIRGFAALWVMLYHFSEKNVDTNSWFHWGALDPLIIRGAAGVDIFFVLSGFILTHVYRNKFGSGLNRNSWLTFLNHRVARLYPVHLVTMLAMVVLFYAAKSSSGAAPHHSYAFSWYSALANLTLTHAWFPGVVGAINGPAWSISAEWFVYLLFPVAYFMLSKSGKTWPWLVALAALLISLGVEAWHPIEQVTVEFCFGMALYELFTRFGALRTRFGGLIGLATLLMSVYVISLSDLPSAQRGDIHSHLRTGVLVAAAVLLTSLANSKDLLGRVLRTGPLVYG
jgi:peptidoglycan/LPS O-acetylase OafA/YrhL